MPAMQRTLTVIHLLILVLIFPLGPVNGASELELVGGGHQALPERLVLLLLDEKNLDGSVTNEELALLLGGK